MEKVMGMLKEKYIIAGLKVLMTTHYQRTRTQAHPYLCEEQWEEEQADCVIDLGNEYYQTRPEAKYLSTEDVEYIYTGGYFNRILLKYDGCMLHSSAVVVDGYAYLFSADSGTGKSTHAQLWLKHFGDRAYIINDDKPALRFEDGGLYVYGTPWSGKTNLNKNAKVKLGAIVFLERAEENRISKMELKDALPKFMKQTVRKFRQEEQMDRALNIIEKILLATPLYRLECNISEEAVVTAYEKIRRV